jgi:carbonic anhydrase
MWAIIGTVVPTMLACAAAAGRDWSLDQPRQLDAANQDWNPEFYADYWPGVCTTGKLQSPLNIKEKGVLPLDDILVTNISMPVVQKPVIKHTGHAIEVQFPLLNFLRGRRDP